MRALVLLGDAIAHAVVETVRENERRLSYDDGYDWGYQTAKDELGDRPTLADEIAAYIRELDNGDAEDARRRLDGIRAELRELGYNTPLRGAA